MRIIMNEEQLNQLLESAFGEARRLYKERGFQRRIGFGENPALINVDLANAWTRPGNPFTCEGMDDRVIPGVQRLLAACREQGHPVIHVTTCYQNTDRSDPHTDMGLWHHKIPIEAVDESNREVWAIDDRIAPVKGEQVLVKKHASAFAGTYLAGLLRSFGVDTILVTGVTACACVRQTICDGIAEGFRPIAVEQCIGDRVPGAVQWNLFDIDAKFGDVEDVDTCVNYLNSLVGPKCRTSPRHA